MQRYQSWSNYYDDIFGINKKALSFIETYTQKGDSVLDIGAGTGAEAAELAEKGYDVTAMDVDEGMVQQMGEKQEQGFCFTSAKLDMREVGQLKNQQFGTVYCIGNTFVHLPNMESMSQVLTDVHRLMKPGGTFMMQIVNYDRVFNEKITQLPTIEREESGLRFDRYYEHRDHDILFTTELIVNNENERNLVFKSEHSLLPMKKQDVELVFEDSPFTHFDIYGDFELGPHSVHAPATIVRAVK
ncbi:class I SAM-dependent methyltransferase [Texcoconibacillus texcoconensis]|uniref:2-polyprenyl-3-methyl-5-hydroxy-6-metoxy-1, 4-benzoquinol methylase n=1 Tax=Texcoconibacillus texcoconensis TaxID=1095777 RepID=A0A840QQ53_9BACI|nr:class I SAM-dependent methyltransferase [Texcoconibacillus texcoconensis]MBB5173490.1 2-polyprenyl-3-methyl-5-hydroxy-6-metoxy-1,4-benzoquinol methylase [Texcoconibacillus texcoconensis]